MGLSRKHETRGSEAKCGQSITIFHWSPKPQFPSGQHEEANGWCYRRMVKKYNYLLLWWRHCISPKLKANLPSFLPREIPSVFPSVVCKNPVPYCNTYRNMEDSWRPASKKYKNTMHWNAIGTWNNCLENCISFFLIKFNSRFNLSNALVSRLIYFVTHTLWDKQMALNTDYRIRIVFLFEHYFILNKDTRVYERAFIYQKHRNHKCEVITTGFYTSQKEQSYISVLEVDSELWNIWQH